MSIVLGVVFLMSLSELHCLHVLYSDFVVRSGDTALGEQTQLSWWNLAIAEGKATHETNE